MNHILAVVMAGIIVVSAAPAAENRQEEKNGEAEAVEKELAKLQGTWELTRRVGNRTVRSIKVINGNKTTLTRYTEDGEVFWAHTSEFRLTITGKVRVFTFFNLAVTAGPHKGGRIEQPSSFIYRVDDDLLTEAHGLLVDQSEEEPRLVTWKRVKDLRSLGSNFHVDDKGIIRDSQGRSIGVWGVNGDSATELR
ncbi:MAG: hypothetical protein H8E44_01115 [Planctomycetes bacterium]|nr:hypothetical protein [Planctomycetota bacterium]